MKITVGKAYEGSSSNRLKDGDYELQITDIESTRGQVKMTLKASSGQSVRKTFFLLSKDGKEQNEKGMRELADYVTTAMQIEDEEVEVDVKDAVGYYVKCYIKNASYKKTVDGVEVEKSIYNLYDVRRCNGFSDGTGSFVEGVDAYDDEPDEPSAEVEDGEDMFDKLMNG